MSENVYKLPPLIQGTYRFDEFSVSQVEELIEYGISLGINFIDTASCYGKSEGECESKLGGVFKKNKGMRGKILLQSKGGIAYLNDGRMYHNYSKEHLLNTLDYSLQRLGTDHLDYFLLHRADCLYEPEEIAEAFDIMKRTGRVLHFGVSNEVPYGIELLQKYCNVPIEVNQLQFGIMHADMCVQQVATNSRNYYASDRDGGILNYCRMKDIRIQAWSPFQFGQMEGCFLDNPEHQKVNDTLQRIADRYGVTKTTIAVAWILRHPADMQVICGTTRKTRLKECYDAMKIRLDYEDWYQIYLDAGYPMM